MHTNLERKTATSTFGLALITVLASACATTAPEQRHLEVTEVGKRRVELYLDEDPSRQPTLTDGYVLTVATHSGLRRRVGLGTHGGNMAGATFLIVWEDSNYSGPPMPEDFVGGQTGAVRGIKVEANFFGNIDSEPSEIRISGTHNRVSGLIVIFPEITPDIVDDVLRFGAPDTDRPDTGETSLRAGRSPTRGAR